MNLHNEALTIARMAMRESRTHGDDAINLIHQYCDGHEVAIYYHKAIQFCADQNTNYGEQWLEDCGGIVRPGDSFGQIACRIAYATLYCATMRELAEMEREHA